MPYNSKQAAVDALLPGYKVVGEAPYVVKVANPQAGGPGQPATIDQTQGSTLSVQGPDGTPDEIIVKEVGNNDNAKGGVGYDVIKGPTKAPARTATPAGGLERLDSKGNAIAADDTTTPAATGAGNTAAAPAVAAPAAAGAGGFTSPVYGGLAQGGANLGGMNLYPTPGSAGSTIAGLAQGGGQGAFPFAQRLQQLQGFTAPGGSGSSPTIVINAGG